MSSKHFFPAKFSLVPQPAFAWIAIFLLAFFTVINILAGTGKILNFAFPIAGLVVGIFLYFRYPLLYVSFTWWIWFLTALIRRLSDYRSSYVEPSPLLLAPFLVTGITVVTLWQHLPKTYRQGGLPFILSFVGVFYGFSVGLIYTSPLTLVKALLGWLTPVTFGFHLFIHWRDYPSYRQNLQRTFLWGILVMGVYGIIQYFVVPEWDRLWIIESEMTSSQGTPVPFGLRVWSTMNSGEPFSAVMGGGLLLLFSCQRALRTPASIVGYLSFLLSTVRSAWLGWLAGLLVYISCLKPNHQIRALITIVILALCILPLATSNQFSDQLGDRFASFSNLEQDHSANVRQQDFQALVVPALTNFFGDGLGNGIGDNGLFSMLFQLGWFGVIFYSGGIFLLVYQVFQSSEGKFDLFAAAARAVIVSNLIRLPVNGVVEGAGGVLLWTFLGISLAANKYYLRQRSSAHS